MKLKPRPGHADYPASVRYGGFQDYRGSGRFSGRITAGYVMAGVVAMKILKGINVRVFAHTIQIGSVKVTKKIKVQDIIDHVYQNSVRCADPKIAMRMEREILTVKEEGDSIGGMAECIALNYPSGLGNPVFDTLDGDIAKIIFSIPAVKGIEFGAGFRVSSLRGSQNNDVYDIQRQKIMTKTNHCGGILGGLSTGMPIIMRVAFKPPSSISKEQQTINLRTRQTTSIKLSGRHDPCIVPRAIPVIESCVSIALVDHAIRLGKIPSILK
jgi:chorismate synthase